MGSHHLIPHQVVSHSSIFTPCWGECWGKSIHTSLWMEIQGTHLPPSTLDGKVSVLAPSLAGAARREGGLCTHPTGGQLESPNSLHFSQQVPSCGEVSAVHPHGCTQPQNLLTHDEHQFLLMNAWFSLCSSANVPWAWQGSFVLL